MLSYLAGTFALAWTALRSLRRCMAPAPSAVGMCKLAYRFSSNLPALHHDVPGTWEEEEELRGGIAAKE